MKRRHLVRTTTGTRDWSASFKPGDIVSFSEGGHKYAKVLSDEGKKIKIQVRGSQDIKRLARRRLSYEDPVYGSVSRRD